MSARGGYCHEIVVKLYRAVRRFRFNYLAVRPGNVANRNRLGRLASLHHGRRAEAGGKATKAGAGGTSPDIVNRSHANRSNLIGFARSNRRGVRFNTWEAC